MQRQLTQIRLPSSWYPKSIGNWVGENIDDLELFDWVTSWPQDLHVGKQYVVFYSLTCDHCEALMYAYFEFPTIPTTLVAIPQSTAGFNYDGAFENPCFDCNKTELKGWTRLDNRFATCSCTRKRRNTMRHRKRRLRGTRMSNLVNAVHDKINADLDQAIARLQTLLRIPSVSTDPAYANDVRRCAEHITDDLKSIGLEAICHDTIGHPMILATDDSAGPDAPRVLYYGHYDVQPPEPFDEWNHPPFDAEIVDGPNGKRIVARGAADDKGQLMTFIEAIRAWKDTYESLPVRVVILLEGEEESGSESLVPFLHKHKDELQADTCIVCDTGMWDPETPCHYKQASRSCLYRGNAARSFSRLT